MSLTIIKPTSSNSITSSVVPINNQTTISTTTYSATMNDTLLTLEDSLRLLNSASYDVVSYSVISNKATLIKPTSNNAALITSIRAS